MSELKDISSCVARPRSGELRALIERVERATGPDREIEFEVGIQMCGFERCSVQESDGPCNEVHEAGYYTSSLDAVVALVERELPGWDWGCETTICGGDNRYSGYVAQKMRIGPEAYGKTPALALLLAFLRAKEALAVEGNVGKR